MTNQELQDALASARTAEVLLVEDNPADVQLIKKSLERGRFPVNLSVTNDGAEAMTFLQQEGAYEDAPRPDLILLDLNMPNVSGQEVLTWLKDEPDLKKIPVVVLTTSDATEDIEESYRLQASSFITKPIELDDFLQTMVGMVTYWLTVVKLPRDPEDADDG